MVSGTREEWIVTTNKLGNPARKEEASLNRRCLRVAAGMSWMNLIKILPYEPSPPWSTSYVKPDGLKHLGAARANIQGGRAACPHQLTQHNTRHNVSVLLASRGVYVPASD